MAFPRKDLVVDPDELEILVRAFRDLTALEPQAQDVISELRAGRTGIIRHLRGLQPQPSWSAIGKLFGISGERARQLGTYDKEK